MNSTLDKQQQYHPRKVAAEALVQRFEALHDCLHSAMVTCMFLEDKKEPENTKKP